MIDKVLRLGFIGGGINSAVGTTHVIAAQMDGCFRLEAGCFSRHPDVNAKSAQQWGIQAERTYNTWKALIDHEKGNIDAVVVLTPTPNHTDPVKAALHAGMPVICEKALSSNSADAKNILKLVNEKRGFLTVTYNYTGYPMLRELKAIIRKGLLGSIEQIHIEMPQEGFSRLDYNGQPIVPQQWRLIDGDIPTILLDLGVHVHHLVDFLTGEKPKELVASHNSFGQFRQVVDNASAIVRYSNGMECTFWLSKAALGNRNGLRVRIFGEDGSAEWFQVEPEILVLNDRLGRKMMIDRGCADTHVADLQRYNRFKAGHPAGFLEAFANLYGDIASALIAFPLVDQKISEYVFSADVAWEGLIMLEAMAVSAREKRWVAVNFEVLS